MVGGLVLAVLASAPTHAWASGFVGAFTGVTFKAQSKASEDDNGFPIGFDETYESGKPWGLNVGWLDAFAGGGFEVEFSRDTKFFEGSSFHGTKLTTIGWHAVFGPATPYVRPYIAPGLLIVITNGGTQNSGTGLAFSIGGGAMGFFSEHLGARFDARYVFSNDITDSESFPIGMNQLRYWRVTFGVLGLF
jgi:hypothetical protein